MAHVRVSDTSRAERGRVVKRYEVIYRAKVRTDDGRVVTRARQETHPTKAAAEARAAELNARKHRRAIDPAEQRARGNRSFDDWAGDWLDAQQTRVAIGKLKSRTADGERRDGTTEPATEAVAGVRLHDLRHTAAVAWLTAGVGVVQVSRWLGHAQPTVTMNVYGDWVPAEAENPLPEPKFVSNVLPLPNRTG